MIRQIKAWGIYHKEEGPISYGDGSPMVYKDREEAQYECPDEREFKAVRVTLAYAIPFKRRTARR